MYKIIFVNGPPGSGKDRAGYIIRSQFNAHLYKMSRPLKDGLSEFFGFDYSYLKEVLEPNKDVGSSHFNGLTWLEVQISLSETWAKPLLGHDIFGRLAVEHLRKITEFDMTVITDSGFLEECLPVVKHFGADNCFLIHLIREGCTFEGDSRNYIDLDDFGVAETLLDNRYPLTETDDMPITYGMQLASTIRGWLGSELE